MDFALDPDIQAYRQELRRFATKNLAPHYQSDDKAGRMRGRTKDIIIRGGENIPVVYVENTLYENPKLASVAVVGIPDPRVQERACACVTLAPGVTEFTFQEMQEFLREKGLARQYWPERLQVMDALPSTPSGKIQKFALRAIVKDQP
jgi:non-ribosomal peptide synthetase component E (peptide arylation enzyme)